VSDQGANAAAGPIGRARDSTWGDLYRAAVLGGVTIGFSALGLGAAVLGGGQRFTWLAQRWARIICRLCGVRVEVEGEPVPSEAPAYVVMANHSSHFDVIALYAGYPGDVRPVAKRELGWIPVFGWVLRAGAAIMIDRGDRRRATASIERAGQTIRGGRSVLMFPEGTRTPGGVVGPLKKGPFHLALAARVPILPIGIEGSGDVLPRKGWRIRPGVIRLRIGSPIPTSELRNGPAVRVQLSQRVRDALAELSKGRLEPPDVPWVGSGQRADPSRASES
jgi:1-acyl-sn-glycerol-3-phosphate acyltransferase